MKEKSAAGLLDDDPDWPADETDDYTGCAAINFISKPTNSAKKQGKNRSMCLKIKSIFQSIFKR